MLAPYAGGRSISTATPTQVRQRRLIATLAVLALIVVSLYLAFRPDGSDGYRVSAPSLPAQFIKSAVGPAQASEHEFGVPTSVALAQAILESNWAQSELTKEGNAYFGIKCGQDKGKYATGCLKKPTSECEPDGTCTKVLDSFRTYATATDSFRDHGHFLASNDRYAEAFLYTTEPDQFSREIAKAGYATDPGYADKVIALMHEYDLYQYNDPK